MTFSHAARAMLSAMGVTFSAVAQRCVEPLTRAVHRELDRLGFLSFHAALAATAQQVEYAQSRIWLTIQLLDGATGHGWVPRLIMLLSFLYAVSYAVHIVRSVFRTVMFILDIVHSTIEVILRSGRYLTRSVWPGQGGAVIANRRMGPHPAQLSTAVVFGGIIRRVDAIEKRVAVIERHLGI